MAISYKLLKNEDGSNDCNENVRRNNGDGTYSFIPFNDDNADYLLYKEWLAAGNTPEAAD